MNELEKNKQNIVSFEYHINKAIDAIMQVEGANVGRFLTERDNVYTAILKNNKDDYIATVAKIMLLRS